MKNYHQNKPRINDKEYREIIEVPVSVQKNTFEKESAKSIVPEMNVTEDESLKALVKIDTPKDVEVIEVVFVNDVLQKTFTFHVQKNGTVRLRHKRKTLHQKVRQMIAAKQEWKCKRCEKLFDEGGFDINHIIEVAAGGTNDTDNLEAVCKCCHGIITAQQVASRGITK